MSQKEIKTQPGAPEGAQEPISFKLSGEQQRAIQALAGKRGVRIAGYIEGEEVKIDFIAINAGVVGISATPFSDPGMAPFIACNGPIADTGSRSK